MHVFALMELTNLLNLLFTQNISSEHLFSACQEANLNYLHKPVFLAFIAKKSLVKGVDLNINKQQMKVKQKQCNSTNHMMKSNLI